MKKSRKSKKKKRKAAPKKHECEHSEVLRKVHEVLTRGAGIPWEDTKTARIQVAVSILRLHRYGDQVEDMDDDTP